MAMSSFDTLIQDLVIANGILAKEDVVDACGQVSVRHPDNPRHFLIARPVAAELVSILAQVIQGEGLTGTNAVPQGLDQGVRKNTRFFFILGARL